MHWKGGFPGTFFLSSALEGGFPWDFFPPSNPNINSHPATQSLVRFQKEELVIIMWQLMVKGLEGKTHLVDIKGSHPEVGIMHSILLQWNLR